MEYSQIRDLRDELRSYLKDIRTNICSGKQQSFDPAPLRQAIGNFNIDEVPDFLAKINVNKTNIIRSMKSLDILLMDSMHLIEDEIIHICKIDELVYSILYFCEEFHILLLKEIKKLEVRRSTDIIESDKYLLKHILAISDNKTDVLEYITLQIRGLSTFKAHRVFYYAISEIEKNSELPNQYFILKKLKATLYDIF